MGSTPGESSICSIRWAVASVTYPLVLGSGFLSTRILPLKLFCCCCCWVFVCWFCFVESLRFLLTSKKGLAPLLLTSPLGGRNHGAQHDLIGACGWDYIRAATHSNSCWPCNHAAPCCGRSPGGEAKGTWGYTGIAISLLTQGHIVQSGISNCSSAPISIQACVPHVLADIEAYYDGTATMN